jgi:hypothetical protein
MRHSHQQLSTEDYIVGIRYWITIRQERRRLHCRVCELAIVLYLLGVTSYESPINLITNPNPVSSLSNT